MHPSISTVSQMLRDADIARTRAAASHANCAILIKSKPLHAETTPRPAPRPTPRNEMTTLTALESPPAST